MTGILHSGSTKSFLGLWIIIFFGLGMTNFRHHYGCKFTNPYDSSNIMSGPPFGILGFNIGYHVSHHIKPALHWSLLPIHHESIKNEILRGKAAPSHSESDHAEPV